MKINIKLFFYPNIVISFILLYLFYPNPIYAATIFASPGDNITQKAHSLAPGDTLSFHDGTYNGSLSTNGMNGTATAPITITAEHDGKAIIDGGNTANAAIDLSGSSYITIQGLVARNVTGSVVRGDNSSHVIISRVTAYNAGSGNTNCFSMSNGATYGLVVDSASWGRCRYGFLAYHSNHITFRRTFAKWEQTDNFSPAPRSGYGAYGSTDISFENAIGYDIQPTAGVSDFFSGVWETSDGPTTQNISYYGDIFYHVLGDGIRVNDLKPFQNTIIKDSFFDNPLLSTISYPFTKGAGVEWVTPITGIITNDVFVGNNIGVNQGNAVPTLTNSVFIGNTKAIAGSVQASNNAYWPNGSNGITPGNTDQQADPGYDTTKYGTGAYFFVPSTSPLKGAGQGGDIGAHIIYEYENGQLTNKPLWPWPMEDRIKAEKGISVTWESGGGFWKTLDGVYGTGGSTPPPTSNTPATSPSSIPNPGGSTFSISLCPHGFGNCGDNANAQGSGNMNPLHPQRQATLILTDAQNNPVSTQQGQVTYNPTTNTFSGMVTINTISSGTYIAKIKLDGFLPHQYPGFVTVTSAQSSITLPTLSLVTGDINNDNQLDILDYNLLISCFGSKADTSSCQNKQSADLTDDGTIDGADYNLFLRELSVQKGG